MLCKIICSLVNGIPHTYIQGQIKNKRNSCFEGDAENKSLWGVQERACGVDLDNCSG